MDDEPGLVVAEPLDVPPQQSWLKHLLVFLRSVIPADPWQLIYLVGLVFVLVLGALPIVSPDTVTWPGGYLSGGGSFDTSALVPYVVVFAWVSLAASCAGFFICFWPGRKPALRIAASVILPTISVLALLVWRIYQLTEPATTIFEPHNIGSFFHWFRANVWRFPTGPYVGACGVALVSIYALRLSVGRSSLPISVSPTGLASQEDIAYWPRIQWLLWALFGAYIVLSGLLVWPFTLLEFKLLTRFPSSVIFPLFMATGRFLDAGVLLGIALFILGKQGKQVAIKSLRLPEPRYALIGILCPVIIFSLVPIGHWAVDRIQWAQHHIGLLPPPQFSAYLELDSAWQPWLFLLIFGAFAEEVIFRGVLLAFFIKRYGLYRGIFFTGTAWAMIHFRSDRYLGENVGGVLLHLVFRVAFCLALNFVFAWMTLRWKSIIPAGLAHTFWNILAMSGLVVSFEWTWGLEILLWAALAIVLWHYWPVESWTEDTSIPPNAPEPVV